MPYVKQFRVADLVVCPHDNSHFVYLCSMWGEYYRVAIDGYINWSSIWGKGTLVEVPLKLVKEGSKGDRAMVPDWSAFGEDAAVQFELLDAYTTVCHIWGREIAERYLPLDTPPQSVIQAVIESEMPKRRRRKSETPKSEVSIEPPPRDKKDSTSDGTLF